MVKGIQVISKNATSMLNTLMVLNYEDFVLRKHSELLENSVCYSGHRDYWHLGDED